MKRNRRSSALVARCASAIRTARKAHGITQAELGRRIGVSDRTIRAWERGRTLPSPNRFGDVCRELGIDPISIVPMDSRLDFGAAIRTGRRIAGLTQRDMASVVGVSVATIKRWESGERPQPRNAARAASILHRIAAHFGAEKEGR